MKNRLSFLLLRLWNFYTHINLYLNSLVKNIKKFKKLNIIFIKPYDYLDIYNKNFEKNHLNLLCSNYRMGPVGLFTNHNTKFVISSSYNDNDINFLKTKKKLSKIRQQELVLQKKKSKNINMINFNHYDLAISFEDTISERTISKYDKVLWFKIFEDHKKKSYKKNIIFKPKFFDGVLNQTLGFTPYSLFRRLHSIDFSYTFGNSSFLKKIKKKSHKDIDIILEVNQKKKIKNYLTKLKSKNSYPFIKKIYTLSESLSHKKYIDKISKSQFFLSLFSNSPRWGNSLIEAAICQNLIIGNRNCFWNSQLIIKQLHCTKIEKALYLVNILKTDRKLFDEYLKKQNFLLDYLNYTRPLQQIIDYSLNCNRDLNILRKIK